MGKRKSGLARSKFVSRPVGLQVVLNGPMPFHVRGLDGAPVRGRNSNGRVQRNMRGVEGGGGEPKWPSKPDSGRARRLDVLIPEPGVMCLRARQNFRLVCWLKAHNAGRDGLEMVSLGTRSPIPTPNKETKVCETRPPVYIKFTAPLSPRNAEL